MTEHLETGERAFLVDALQAHRGATTDTAARLGIGRKTLWEKMRRYGIDKQEFGSLATEGVAAGRLNGRRRCVDGAAVRWTAQAKRGVRMSDKLVLVDYENVQRIDLSILDESYRAIVFVGANQQPPKAARHPATAHRFSRVDFQKVEGTGRNALDFHVAFHLGRTFETAPQTECFVLSRDKGYDPLLLHLNRNGVKCRRIEALEELLPRTLLAAVEPQVVCKRCGKSSTIEHHAGRWCSNCGCFSSPPDPALLPSLQPGYRDNTPRRPFAALQEREEASRRLTECAWCDQRVDMGDGIYDDGEWMCGACIARHAR